jgi:hypothetical protein
METLIFYIKLFTRRRLSHSISSVDLSMEKERIETSKYLGKSGVKKRQNGDLGSE